MARSKGQKRPFAPGAGQDAGRHRQQYPQATAEHSFKGRDVGGELHRQGEKRNKATPKPEAKAAPKPQPSALKPSTSNEVAAFTRAAARRGAPAPSAQRDRLIALGIIKKEAANV